MPIEWKPEEKVTEWQVAKKKLINIDGTLLPNGTKLRRKDSKLNHSFMVVNSKIIALSGKGLYLGTGADAHAKLAEDEAGNLIALKIFDNVYGEAVSVKESEIAHDLGIAGRQTSRTSASKNMPKKHYIDYQYLGIPLKDYLEKKSLSFDQCYKLCIQISLALHDIHAGIKTKSTQRYSHSDIHLNNIVIDDQGNPHFIDFGRAYKTSQTSGNSEDIVKMLLLFFTPAKNRYYKNMKWIFSDWLGEYNISHGKPSFFDADKYHIYIYVESSDIKEDGSCCIVHYVVNDLAGIRQEVIFELDKPGLTEVQCKKYEKYEYMGFTVNDELLLKNKVLEIATQKGHIINQKNWNEALFNLLHDPNAFYQNRLKIPTALDIAEVLTLSRLNLNFYQHVFKSGSQEKRLEAIYVLNAISTQLLSLRDRLCSLNNNIEQSIKDLLVSQIIGYLKAGLNDFTKNLAAQLELLDAKSRDEIKEHVNVITKIIAHEKEQWKLNNINAHNEPNYSTVNKQNEPIPKDAYIPVQKKILTRETVTTFTIEEKQNKVSEISKIKAPKTFHQFKSKLPLKQQQVDNVSLNDMKRQHEEPLDKNKQYQQALDQHHKKFLGILELITPLKCNRQIAGHKKLERCLSTLYENLSDAGQMFFKSNNIDEVAFKTFESSCQKQINLAELAFNPAPGFWNDYLRPVLMGILGVVIAVAATLLTAGILPVVVVCNSERRSDYINEFFKSTSSLKKGLVWRELKIQEKLFGYKEEHGLMQDIDDLIQLKNYQISK